MMGLSFKVSIEFGHKKTALATMSSRNFQRLDWQLGQGCFDVFSSSNRHDSLAWMDLLAVGRKSTL